MTFTGPGSDDLSICCSRTVRFDRHKTAVDCITGSVGELFALTWVKNCRTFQRRAGSERCGRASGGRQLVAKDP